MRAIKEGYEKPYNFHMCWTSNKHDKIRYFKNVDMWYVNEQCESAVSMVGPNALSAATAGQASSLRWAPQADRPRAHTQEASQYWPALRTVLLLSRFAACEVPARPIETPWARDRLGLL